MVRLVNLHGRPLVRCAIFESFPYKKEPRNSRNSAEKFLAFHAFLYIRKSQESQESLGFPGIGGDSWLQEIPHFPGFPRFHCLLESQECYSQKPGEAWKARKKCSALSWLSPMCKKAQKGRNDSQLSRIPPFLGKHGIPT